MAKYYGLRFGSGNPASKSGLSPTFTLFYDIVAGTTAVPPAISEILTQGLYQFQYGVTSPLFFIVDGGPSLSNDDRYNVGSLDPIQVVDEKVGTVNDSFGSTLTDPTTVLGFQKRNQEWLEGDATFTKATGEWAVSSRGASTLLRVKALSNNTTLAEKE